MRCAGAASLRQGGGLDLRGDRLGLRDLLVALRGITRPAGSSARADRRSDRPAPRAPRRQASGPSRAAIILSRSFASPPAAMARMREASGCGFCASCGASVCASSGVSWFHAFSRQKHTRPAVHQLRVGRHVVAHRLDRQAGAPPCRCSSRRATTAAGRRAGAASASARPPPPAPSWHRFHAASISPGRCGSAARCRRRPSRSAPTGRSADTSPAAPSPRRSAGRRQAPDRSAPPLPAGPCSFLLRLLRALAAVAPDFRQVVGPDRDRPVEAQRQFLVEGHRRGTIA